MRHGRRRSGDDSTDDDGTADPAEVHEGAALAEGDLLLYDLLNDEDFADRAFELLAVPLVEYARPILLAWTASGRIYTECAKHSWQLAPTDAERDHLNSHREEVDDLVGETLARALLLLRANAVAGEQKWSRTGGAALTTYFVGACLLTFPTPFRRWSREFRDRPVPTADDDEALTGLIAPGDAEQQVTSEIDMRKRLDDMPPQVRRIVELKIDGSTHGEIAVQLGMSSARAVEAVLRRYRQNMRDGRGER